MSEWFSRKENVLQIMPEVISAGKMVLPYRQQSVNNSKVGQGLLRVLWIRF